MRLYLAPGACSLADHIALNEAELDFDPVAVDLKARRTDDGRDYAEINPKGYVPALELDDGQVLTENVAILSWVAERVPRLGPGGALGRSRLLEALGYISSEIHKAFKPFFRPGASDAEKAEAAKTIGKRLAYFADRLTTDYLFGGQVSVADCYLYVMLTWAKKNAIPLPPPLPAFFARMTARPAVRRALKEEGLEQQAA